MAAHHFTVVATRASSTPQGPSATPLSIRTVGSVVVEQYSSPDVEVADFAAYATVRLLYERSGLPLPDSLLSAFTATQTYDRVLLDTSEYQREAFNFTAGTKAIADSPPSGGFTEQGVAASENASLFLAPDGSDPTNQWMFFVNYVAADGNAVQLASTDDDTRDIRFPWRAGDLDKARLSLPNKGGNPAYTGTVQAGTRVSLVCGQNGANLYLYVKLDGGAWQELINNNTNNQGTNVEDWGSLGTRFLTDSTASAPFNGTLYRCLFHKGAGAPDGTDSAVRDALVQSDGSIVSPAKYHYRKNYGRPDVDFLAPASVVRAGRNIGTGTNLQATGEFDGVMSTPDPTTKVLDFNLGGVSGTGGATALLNQAKQADGGWFFGGNPSDPNGSRVEDFPANINADGYPTSFPSGYDTVFLRWAWEVRPPEDFGAWKAEWTGNLNGATPDVSGIVSGETVGADNITFTLTSSGDNNWSFVFRDFMPDVEVFESLLIYPTAHPEVSDWKARIDAGEYWNPRLVEVATTHGVHCARVMDMQGINDYKYSDYASHPGLNAPSWSDGGVPFVAICDLITRIGADVSQWQVPHTFSTTDADSLGNFVALNTPTGHKVKVGSSNEVGWQTSDGFDGQRFWVYRGAILDYGDLVGSLTVTEGQTVLTVPDSSVFTVNELVAFDGDGDIAVYKVTATATGPDTITIEELATDGGIQVAQTANLYRLDGLTGSSPNEALDWHTRQTYLVTKAFREGWQRAKKPFAACRPVLEVQSADIGVATTKISAPLWEANFPAEYVNPRTYFYELQIAPYIGGGMDRQQDVRDITTDPATTQAEKFDLIKAYMVNPDLVAAPRSIYQRLGEIEAHQTLIDDPDEVVPGQIIEVGVYECGGGMLQGGPPGGPELTQEEIDFYAAFLKTQQMADVFELFLQELIANEYPQFMIFALVSTPSKFGSYTPIFDVDDVDDPTNKAAQWQIGLKDRNLAPWSPARIALEAV